MIARSRFAPLLFSMTSLAGCYVQPAPPAGPPPGAPAPTAGTTEPGQPAPVEAAPASGPRVVTAADVVGHWTGDWGDLYLRADADGTVRGVYPHDTGTVMGRIDNGVFHGWWCEVPSRKPSQDAGVVEFTFVRAGNDFNLDGRWKYGTDEETWRENWDLRWVDGNVDPALASRFDDASQFCKP